MKSAFNIAINRASTLLAFLMLALCMLGGAPARSATVISPDMEWYQSSYNGVYAISTDRSIMAIGRGFGFIELHNTSDGSLIRSIYTNCDYRNVASLAFSPDGNILAVSLGSGTMQIWNLSDGSLSRTFTGVYLNDISFSPDGQMIAGGSGISVKLIRVIDGSLVRTFSGSIGMPRGVVFSPNGNLIASFNTTENVVRVWRVSTGVSERVISDHTNYVTQLAFSPDGTKFLSASYDKTILVWNVTDWSLIHTVTDVDVIQSIAFSPDGSKLAYSLGFSDDTIIQVDTQNWQVMGTPSAMSSARIKILTYSANGNHIFSGTDIHYPIFCAWDALTGENEYTLQTALFNAQWRCYISPDASKAFNFQYGFDIEQYAQFNGITGAFEGVIPFPDDYSALEYSPDGSKMIRAGFPNIVIVDSETDDVLHTLTSSLTYVSDVKFSPDGSLVAARYNGDVAIWNVATGDLLREFTADDRIEEMAFSPDNQKMVTIDSLRNIEYRNLLDGSTVWESNLNPNNPPGIPVWGDGFYPRLISVKPDGSQIAVFVTNKGVRYFSTINGAYISSWINAFESPLLTTDWEMMISSNSADDVITVSRFSDHQVIENRAGHSSNIYDFALSADMSKLLSMSSYGELALWNITPPYMPDLMIKSAADTNYVGRRRYRGDASQRVDASGNITAPAVYHVRLMNGGFNTDNLMLKGTAGHDGWSVRYFSSLTGGSDITAQVTGAGWRLAQVTAGSNRDIRVEVTPSHQGFAGDTIDVELWAVSETNPATRYDRVYTTTTSLEHYQPDLYLKNHADAVYIGDDIYSNNGATQAVSNISNPGITLAYDFVIQNDSNVPDTFKITGTSGGSGWTVRYFKDFDDFAEITNAVIGGGWSTGELAVDATLAFHAEVTADSSVAGNAQKTLLVRAISTMYAGPTEVAKVVQTNPRMSQPDMTIRAGDGPVVGAGIYANDGTGQTVSIITPTGQAAKYYLTVTNRGNTADKFLIRRTVGGNNWTVKYYNATGADVTSAVTLSSFTTPTLAVGASYAMRVEVTPNLYVAVNAVKELLISATSYLNSTLVDATRTVTTKMPLTSVRLQANPSQGSGLNMPISLTAIPTGGKTIEYQYYVTDPTGQTTLVRSYAGGNPYVWIPTLIGTHVVTVWAREVGDPLPYNASATLTYLVPDVQLRGVLLAAEVHPGVDVLFTATQQGGGNQTQFRFRIRSGSVWTDLQLYGASRTCSWIPERVGSYTVRVYAKEVRNGRTLEYYKDLAIRVTSVPPPPARLTAVLLEALPASPQLANTPITLTATPTGGTNVEYRFRILEGSVWRDLTTPEYVSENSIVWTPTERRTYTINVYAHEVGTPLTSQVMKSITFNIY